MSTPAPATTPLTSTRSLLVLAFKTLVWLNGLGVAAILAVALGVFPSPLQPIWLRLPFALFLVGIALSMLGLLWTGITHQLLMRQMVSTVMRRSHWVPALLATCSYVLALGVFVAACWAFLGVATLSHYYDEAHSGIERRGMPGFQHP